MQKVKAALDKEPSKGGRFQAGFKHWKTQSKVIGPGLIT